MRNCLFAFLVLCLALISSTAYTQQTVPTGTESQDAKGLPSADKPFQGQQEALRLLEALQSQQREMGQELRAIKREIAALKTAMQEPDFKDIVGGIGYISGIFGIAFYLHARRERRRQAP
ncbi:MAG: hypothetical protein WHS46_03815 [Desulfosoma sp.]